MQNILLFVIQDIREHDRGKGEERRVLQQRVRRAARGREAGAVHAQNLDKIMQRTMPFMLLLNFLWG